jgi:hypothetical protein
MQPTLHATREKTSPLTSTPLTDQQSSLGIVPKPGQKRQQLNSIGERTIVVQLLAVGCCKLLHTIKKVNGQHLIVTIDQYHLKRVHFSSSLKDCYCFSGLDGELV